MYKYIGLDAHSSTCTFCVLDEQGREIDLTTMATNGRMLVNYVKELGGAKKLTFEECELSGWLHQLFNKEVEELIVCNPVMNREFKRAKTDKIDARKLAKLLRGGFLTPVFHDGSKREQLRSVVSAYQDIVEEAVRLKNRYKSVYRKDGKMLRGSAVYSDESLLDGLENSGLKFVGGHIYDMIALFEKKRQELLKELIRCSKQFKEVALLKQIPGIGDIHSAKIVSQVVDPRRFRNKNKYYSYCGLIRHKRISGENQYGSARGGYNRILKSVYKTAGQTVIRGENGLRRYYDALREKGTSHENAYNAVCRKIAAISLSIWRKSAKYDENLVNAQAI